MKASTQWIRALVPGLSCSNEELATRFIAAGLAVDASSTFGAGTESCLVVSVVSMRPHPTKSGLRLVTVDRGDAHAEVVCGAPNVPPPGGLLVLAPLGTYLPAKGMTIESRAIGGIVSEGMLCSEKELGLSDEGEGILILPPGIAPPGTRLIDAIPAVQDTIFEIDLTPNRPDALGHIGLAREAAALFGLAFEPPTPESPARIVRDESATLESQLQVTIEDGERCPHYTAAAVVDVAIGPSPLWLRYRLSSLGVRSISNAVDVTNLVMLEYGHPLHAFDLDRVRGSKIVVRCAQKGEKLTTLDGQVRDLDEDDLVICDAGGPVALAGIMGGESSEITPATRRILIESAYFNPRSVRRAARRHGIHSESSHRFERGVDYGDTLDALAHAAALTSQLASGLAMKGTVRAMAREISPPTVTLRAARLNALLGCEVPFAEARAILKRLGFVVQRESASELELRVPTHRPDVTREVDVIDEVGRVRGLDAIPSILPAIRRAQMQGEGVREELVRRTRAIAVELGLSEAITYGFTSREALAQVGAPEPSVILENPLASHLSVMRTSLFPGLLEAAVRATRRGENATRLFVAGSVFLSPPKASAKPLASGDGAQTRDAGAPSRADHRLSPQPTLPEERLTFAAVLSGERPTYLAKPESVDVWDAKALAQGMTERFLRREATVLAIPREEVPTHLHPRGAAYVEVEGERVGAFGPIHPKLQEELGLGADTMLIELDVAHLAAFPAVVPHFVAIPRFPPSIRDLAIVVESRIAVGEVEKAVRQAAGELAENVRLFDRFVGGSIPEGHASLAFRMTYRARDRTLTDIEVDTRHAAVVADVRARFGATLRE